MAEFNLFLWFYTKIFFHEPLTSLVKSYVIFYSLSIKVSVIFSGMAASFTTVLIEHYEKHFSSSKDEFASNKDLVEAMIGTFQDIPPIIVALIGGYLQQVFGPRKVLIASGFPSILSWILVAAGKIRKRYFCGQWSWSWWWVFPLDPTFSQFWSLTGPSSISCLLMSRICAGLAFGLLSGNVYMVHVASDANIGSMKMVEVDTKKHLKTSTFIELLIVNFPAC